MATETLDIIINSTASKASLEIKELDKAVQGLGLSSGKSGNAVSDLEKAHGRLGTTSSGLRGIVNDLTGSFGSLGGGVGVLGGAFGNLSSTAETMASRIGQAMGTTSTTTGRSTLEQIASIKALAEQHNAAVDKMDVALAAYMEAEKKSATATTQAEAQKAAASQAAAKEMWAAAQAEIDATATAAAEIEAANSAIDVSSGGLLIVLGAIATAIMGVGVLAEQGVGKYMALAEQTHQLQLATGMTAEQASGLIYQFGVAGVSSDRLTQMLNRLTGSMDSSKNKLSALGIEISHNADGTVNMAGTLEAASKAYNTTSDQAEKSAIATALFGRNAAGANIILSQGINLQKDYAAAQAAGVGMNEQQVTAAYQLQMAEGLLKQEFSGLEQKLATDIIPVLTGLITVITNVIKWSEQAAHSIDQFTKSLGPFGTVLKDVLSVVNPLGDALGTLAHIGSTVATQQQINTQLANDEAKAFDTLLKGSQALTSEMLNLNDAQNKVDQAALAIKENLLDQADAQAALTKLEQTHGVDAQTVQNDQESLASARYSQTQALVAQAKAQTDMNTVMTNAAQIIEQYANAYNSATTSVNQDTLDTQKAQNQLAITTDPSKRAQLELDLQKAQEKGVDDTYKQTQAGQAKAQVDQQGIQGTKEWQSANAAIVSTNEQVHTTTDAVTKASQALALAQLGDANYAEDHQRALDKLHGTQLTGISDANSYNGSLISQAQLEKQVPFDFAQADGAIQAQAAWYLSDAGSVGILNGQIQQLLALGAQAQNFGSTDLVQQNGHLVPSSSEAKALGATNNPVLGAMHDGLTGGAMKGGKSGTDYLNLGVDALSFLYPMAGPMIQGFNKLANLFGFADGGIVGARGSDGDPVAAIVHQGEAVLNKGQQAQLAGLLGNSSSTGAGFNLSIGQIVLGPGNTQEQAHELVGAMVVELNRLGYHDPNAGLNTRH